MKKRRAGFTLVELLIYMSLLSAVLIVAVDIFVFAVDDRLESETGSSIVADGRFILSRLMYDIARADTILIPASLGEQTPTLQIVISGINYTYGVNNNNLELTTNLGTNVINSVDTSISDVSFQRLGNPSGKNTIQIRFTLTSKTQRKSGPEIKNFQTTVGLR